MKSSEDKTENKSPRQKDVKHMTREERRKRANEVFERIVDRNGDALTRLSKN